MAEILLNIQDNSDYESGDVLCAFSDKKIKITHAQHVCHPRNNLVNTDGYLLTDNVTQKYMERTALYKFERVSHYEVLRTNLSTLDSETFGVGQIDVPQFLSRRRANRTEGRTKLPIFGTDGNEIWYGGTRIITDAIVSGLWDDIELLTDELRTETHHTLWTFGRLEVRHMLPIRIDNFTDQEAADMVRPRFDVDNNGDRIKNSKGEDIEVARRNIKVDWRRDLLDDLQLTEAQILDMTILVGQDVTRRGKLVHYSKDQPVQLSNTKLFHKERGKNAQEVRDEQGRGPRPRGGD